MLELLKNKKNGNISIFLVVLFCLYLLLSILFGIVYREVITASLYKLKTKCDMSNLATYKEINQRELGATGEIVFEDTDLNNVYYTFKSYLIENLNLDSNLKPLDSNSFVTEPFTIDKIIVYSFKGGLLSEYEYTATSNSFVTILKNYSGTTTTPTGRTVDHTAVYTEVGFKYNLIKGYTYSNHVTSYTDAVNK